MFPKKYRGSARRARGLKQKRPLHVCNEYSHTPPLCFVIQNIGEVARSDGGVEKTGNSSDKVKPPLSLSCPVALRGVFEEI